MGRLNLEYLFEDKEDLNPNALPDYTSLDFVSNGSHIYGEIMWPTGDSPVPRPCVIMLHGFPGSARNDDISHALCRIGCVVLVPHHRGAWGSEGKYLVTNCVEDAENLAHYAHSDEFCAKYNIDPDRIFLLGHSMGGNSALNAGRKITWLRGIILLAPFDPTIFIERGREAYFSALLNEGKILQSDGIDSIYDDIVENREELSFVNAFHGVKDKNIIIFTARFDTVSENELMIMPLWRLLRQRETSSIQKLIDYPVEHGLLGRRISMIREIGKFINES